ncbi:hypothetical protein HHL17_18710 [Chitinophaga sp. G-6-1-13]|uniref:Uncharacterized protein n=1 Tax=Chitinophaga fulva TaxID=2728842 RepID=A0A848GU09_9BACT|nr:hypothetical protein [Chitinophaga fulva]NML39238.1 hypothetical protein [Chitinophaga fulva]
MEKMQDMHVKAAGFRLSLRAVGGSMYSSKGAMFVHQYTVARQEMAYSR